MAEATNQWTQYQNPRFCVDHLLRDEGIGSLSGWTAATGYPLDRVLDNKQQPYSKANAAAATTLKFTRAEWPTVSNRIPMDRVVIMGHNFHGNHCRVWLEHSDDDITYEVMNEASRGTHPRNSFSLGEATHHMAPPDLIDWYLFYNDTWAPTWDYIKLHIEAGKAGYTAPQISELWFTRTLQTDAGPDHEWDNGFIPNVSQSETRAGYVSTTVHGEDRRRFALGWDRLSVGDPGITATGSDLEMLRYVKRKAGIRKNTLLYQHSDMSGAATVLDSFTTTTGLSEVNCTLTNRAGEGPGGTTITRQTALAAGVVSSTQTFDPVIDMRECVLELWLRTNTASMPDVKGTLRVTLASGYGTDAQAATSFNLNDQLPIEELVDTWYKLSFDPETWADTAYYGIGGQKSPVDLSSVKSVTYWWEAGGIGQQLDLAQFILRPKRNNPVLCHLTDYTEKQVGRNPSNALQYDVRMKLEEVLT